jgi:hypothetical protein
MVADARSHVKRSCRYFQAHKTGLQIPETFTEIGVDSDRWSEYLAHVSTNDQRSQANTGASTMTRQHYHVISGLQGGYMPNSNDLFDRLSDARAYAISRANDARDNEDTVRGNARDGFYTIGEWEYIEITSCNDDCEQEDF